jgi:CIC family chloride channel protein
MGAMVGGGTGAVMTAITMIFEMTRDYDIILPMIIAVAVSVGIRRLLSPENIYTLKLLRRGHVIPKAMHANMFLVRRAKEVMDVDVTIVGFQDDFETFLTDKAHRGRMRHAVVVRSGRVVGVLRVNTALRRTARNVAGGVTFGEIASRHFTLVQEDSVVFDVIQGIARAQAIMAVVIRGPGEQGIPDIAGVITKEHIADSIANSLAVYPE